MKTIFIILILSLISTSFSQIIRERTDQPSTKVLDHISFEKDMFLKNQNVDRSQFKYIPKRPGHYSAEDWRSIIDSTWGAGLPTAKKLEIFDYCWNLIDKEYPSFFHINVNWDSLRVIYRPEVAAGVSRGRFCAIMNYMVSNLIDWHTQILDVAVNYDSPKPGTPLFVTNGVISMFRKIYLREDVHHFGASLAPLPDSSVFVYDVVANHPLGLEVGDIILGYDNIPWRQLYKELKVAELPISGGIYGSNPRSVTHGLLTAVGENWHLFDIIDFVKYSSGDTLHLPTSLLVGQQMQLLTSDQLPIPGVPFPDLDNGHFVSWGIVDGTKTGYIYVLSWILSGRLPYITYNPGDDFVQALQILINDYQVDGLIIDSRFNTGGWIAEYLKGPSVLFNEDQDSFLQFIRDNASDHYEMKMVENDYDLRVKATPYLFDRPIAVLTGPFSLSCGDFMPMQMRTHPMVRTFGLGTNGAFGPIVDTDINSISNEWDFNITYSNFTMVDQPDLFLTHLNIPPDEEIWFTQESAVRAEDIVVKRALEWIQNLAYAHDVKTNLTYTQPQSDSITITAIVENPNNHPVSVLAYISKDTIVIDSIYLSKDGAAGDSIWSENWLPIEDEDFYHIAVKTENSTDSTSRIISNVAHFTTAGPLVIDSYSVKKLSDTFTKLVDFKLKNSGTEITIENIFAQLKTSDTCFTRFTTGDKKEFGDIPAGDTKSLYNAFGFIVDSCATAIAFELEISSNGIVYWTDSLRIVVTDVNDEIPTLPKEFALEQNYPNPFNPEK